MQSIVMPTILAPTNGQKVSFNDPLLIQWENPKETQVTKFHLCVGTENGNWDLMSGEVGLSDRYSLKIPSLPDIDRIYIQLLYKTKAMGDDTHGEEDAYVVDRITVERV